MIDLEAAKRRTAWLKFLQPGDAVRFIGPFDEPPRAGFIGGIDNNWLYVDWRTSDGSAVRSWVFRDSGDCPGARTRIEPVVDNQTDGRDAALEKIDAIQKWRELVMWYGIAMADLIAETHLGRDDALLADTASLLTLGGCLDAP